MANQCSKWAEKIIDLLRQEPGLSKNQLIKRAGGDARMVDAALGELVLRNLIRVERQKGRRYLPRIYLKDGASCNPIRCDPDGQ